MGGKALKVAKTRRYTREEFDTLMEELLPRLRSIFKLVDIPKFYKNKESFGDADFVVFDDKNRDRKKLIQEEFNPNEIFVNSNVISFDYKEFQIDFIFVSFKHYETSLNYLSYNDLGNFIGKIAHRFNLKFGHYGLKFVFKDDHFVDDIILTTNHQQILEFLGFDYAVYLNGFDDMYAIFDYIISSKYFHKDLFKFENLSRANYERDVRRKPYNMFLEYLETIPDNNQYPEKFDLSEFYLNTHFPHFSKELAIIKNNNNLIKEVKSKFNGNLIKAHFNIEEKDNKYIGLIVREYEKMFENKNEMNLHIIHSTKEDILKELTIIYNNIVK